MTYLTRVTDDDFSWPADKLSALRLGRRLVVEIQASDRRRRALVSITPDTLPLDAQARHEGWTHRSAGRGFRLEHWEYDADHVDGFDSDIGAVLLRSVQAADEWQLVAALRQWHLRPRQFGYAWETGDPR